MGLDIDIMKELVEEIAGKDVVVLVELIQGKEDVSEFKIAEKLNLTVNQVRNMLYRLYAHNIVSFIRKKDKKKGWYIYYWTFDEKKGHELYVKFNKEKLIFLKERLKNESTGSYFSCPNNCIRLDLENSMDHDFKCPDCGEVLEQENNARRVTLMGKEIARIEGQIVKPFVETVKRKKTAAKKKPTKKKTAAKKKPAKKKTTKRKPAKKKATPKKKPAKKKTSRKSK